MTSPPSEILTKKRKIVRKFSVEALEGLEFCLKENVQREASVNFAQCLTVLSVPSDFVLLLGILSVSTQDEQVLILNSFKEHRPSLLRKLLRNFAELKEQSWITLLTDLLEAGSWQAAERTQSSSLGAVGEHGSRTLKVV
jgi:hypothetical protein